MSNWHKLFQFFCSLSLSTTSHGMHNDDSHWINNLIYQIHFKSFDNSGPFMWDFMGVHFLSVAMTVESALKGKLISLF